MIEVWPWLLLSFGVLVVVPWCGQRDVGVFCLGGIFWCRDYSALTTMLPPVKLWSSSAGTSSHGVLGVIPWCGQRGVVMFCLGDLFWRCYYTAFTTRILLAKCCSSPVGASAPPSMRESCWCGNFGHRISLCPDLVWTAWCWSDSIGGVFWHRDSSVVMAPIMSVNFWSCLRVARVVGWISDDIAVVLTLPVPLLRTWPCAPQGRGTSLDPKTKLDVDLPCLSVSWYNLVVYHFW